VPIVHGTGCGMSGKDEGYATLFRTPPAMPSIPISQASCSDRPRLRGDAGPDLVGGRKMRSDGDLRYMTIQQTGGTRKTIERGLEELKELAEIANKANVRRCRSPNITVGMQCGGSDGYSGITANPALGAASDFWSAMAAPPSCRKPRRSMAPSTCSPAARFRSRSARSSIERVRWWEDYTARNGGEMDNNPSPGNKRGGLTTILEKSLGAVAKGGSAPLDDVYKFAEAGRQEGLRLHGQPRLRPCSVTGQIASGANIIVFTTGRGSVSGYMPTPCIKLATNSEMYSRMSEDMDINCGDIVSEGVSLEDKGEEIFELISAWPPASNPKARNWASAARNSCPGRSAP
jgi:altronate dehydratase